MSCLHTQMRRIAPVAMLLSLFLGSCVATEGGPTADLEAQAPGTALAVTLQDPEPPRTIAEPEHDEPHWKEHPHHLSVFPSATRVLDKDEHAFTIGVDYEYRVSELLGLGMIAEYAAEPIDSTTLLAVADIHIWEGFAVQTGPGVVLEHEHEESLFVYRWGALYEFELPGGFTISPQIHYDAISGAEDELVYGLAVGRSF